MKLGSTSLVDSEFERVLSGVWDELRFKFRSRVDHSLAYSSPRSLMKPPRSVSLWSPVKLAKKKARELKLLCAWIRSLFRSSRLLWLGRLRLLSRYCSDRRWGSISDCRGRAVSVGCQGKVDDIYFE